MAIRTKANAQTLTRQSFPFCPLLYQHFVGKLWEQFGADAWMSTWKPVYFPPTGIQPDIVAELGAIADPLAAQYVPILLLTETDDRARAQQALATVFNHPQVTT